MPQPSTSGTSGAGSRNAVRKRQAVVDVQRVAITRPGTAARIAATMSRASRVRFS